jgi:DNA-binding transcriptional ArsR family regulator
MTVVVSKLPWVWERRLDAKWALQDARKGDWGCLARHIEAGGLISAETKSFLVAVLRRKIRRPNNRPPVSRTREELAKRAALVWEMEPKVGKEAAIDEAAQRLGVDRRTIQRAIRELRDQGWTKEDECKRDRVYKWLCQLGERFERGEKFPRYEIDPAALSQHFMP